MAEECWMNDGIGSWAELKCKKKIETQADVLRILGKENRTLSVMMTL